MFNVILYLFSLNLILSYEQPSAIPTEIHNNDEKPVVSRSIPTPTASPTPLPKPELLLTKHTGLASYYSRDGCIGCSPNLTMANGEPLDDSKLTVAFMRAPLGTDIKITNLKTGQSVVAEVTDRGGFERLKVPKIVDLSVATKEAIGCPDICEVEIEL